MNHTTDTQRQIAYLNDINVSIAAQIADIASALDYLKNMADKEKASEAQMLLSALHDIAERMAGERAHELYADEDEAAALRLAITAGTACCGDEVDAGPGWAAVEGAMA